MPKPYSLLKFYLSATNHHGVHSPFVYRLLTKGLYPKKAYPKSAKSERIFLKCISYFGATNFRLESENPALKEMIIDSYPGVAFEKTPYDLIYVNASEIERVKTYLPKATGLRTNDTMILIEGIHNSRAYFQAWEWLFGSDEITVSMDLFYCGLLFFRKEQAKEHFKIRI